MPLCLTEAEYSAGSENKRGAVNLSQGLVRASGGGSNVAKMRNHISLSSLSQFPFSLLFLHSVLILLCSSDLHSPFWSSSCTPARASRSGLLTRREAQRCLRPRNRSSMEGTIWVAMPSSTAGRLGSSISTLRPMIHILRSWSLRSRSEDFMFECQSTSEDLVGFAQLLRVEWRNSQPGSVQHSQ